MTSAGGRELGFGSFRFDVATLHRGNEIRLFMENALDSHLLNDFQRDFPLCPAPFAELAAKLGVAEKAVLAMLEQLRRDGKISRVGAVFAPKRIGASTLVAMAVPEEKAGIVKDAVNRFPEVTHNYEREHRYNLWFVVTAGSDGRLQAALGAIARAAGYPLVALPLVQEYQVEPESVSEPPAIAANTGTPHVRAETFSPPRPLDELDRRLVVALQEGIPLFIRPFSVLASRVGCDESEVIERVRSWSDEGLIKRFGVVVRQPEPAVGVDALLVHDVPDQEAEVIGERLAAEPGVSLCAQRQRALPGWPYNLFCMVHGSSRDEVMDKIAGLRDRLALSRYPSDVLFSRERRKSAR